MVNFNNPTKIMVYRCMELLNAKIANARTQHVAKRAAVQRFIPRTVDTKAMYRELQKSKNYEVSKRLSMWEQDNCQAFNTAKNTRLDHLHYKQHKVNERTYHCTWANFPEDHRPKTRPEVKVKQQAPTKRPRTGQIPHTAQPWLAEAKSVEQQ